MSVLDGPRREVRRVVHKGRVHHCRPDADVLVLEDGTTIDEASAMYVSPVDARTIVCVHLNYVSRAVEFGRELEGDHPTYFVKPASTLNGHRGELVRPADCELLNYEGEIAAVVGRPMRRVRADDVWDHLAGFCPANDVGLHDFRDTDSGSMLRVKGQDGFCPLGPGLVSGVDVRESTLRTFVNGVMVQNAPVSEMVWGIDALLEDITRHLTLLPGDVVLTGTPANSRPVFPGDVRRDRGRWPRTAVEHGRRRPCGARGPRLPGDGHQDQPRRRARRRLSPAQGIRSGPLGEGVLRAA